MSGFYLGKSFTPFCLRIRNLTAQALAWAKRNPHTGSRKDYWPHLFNSVNEGVPGITYPLRLIIVPNSRRCT